MKKTQKKADKKKRETVLVTGGAGFIGSHIADELISAGYKVVIVDDLSGGFRKNVNPKAIFVKGSVTNKKLIAEVFKKHSFTYVFHLAAYAAEGLSHFIRHFNYENNLLGSINIINAAVNHGIKCFVFASSIAVYGPNQVPMSEHMKPEPEDPYGISKYAVELDLEVARKMFGLNYIIFRPHNVYGERQNLGDMYRNVLGIFINKAMKDEHLPVFGDGEQQRAFTYIGDVAPVMANSIEHEKAYNHIFNIGAAQPYTVKELAEVISSSMGVPLRLKHLPARNEVKIAHSDHSKIYNFFKITETSIEDGVKKMVEWARTTNIPKTKKFRKIEIEKNLPPSWR